MTLTLHTKDCTPETLSRRIIWKWLEEVAADARTAERANYIALMIPRPTKSIEVMPMSMYCC